MRQTGRGSVEGNVELILPTKSPMFAPDLGRVAGSQEGRNRQADRRRSEAQIGASGQVGQLGNGQNRSRGHWGSARIRRHLRLRSRTLQDDRWKGESSRIEASEVY